jgi:predicted nucleotidyltransferase
VKVFFAMPAAAVIEAARSFANELASLHREVKEVHLVGSYARGDHGPNSDVDLIVIVDDTRLRFIDRPLEYGPRFFPLPVDMFVYTNAEWERGVRAGLWEEAMANGITLYRRDES